MVGHLLSCGEIPLFDLAQNPNRYPTQDSYIVFNKLCKQFFDHTWHLDIEQIRVSIRGLIDDCFLMANSLSEMSSVLTDLGEELEQAAELQLQHLKLEYVINESVVPMN